MSKVVICAGIIAFIVSAVMGPLFIPFLTKLKCGQTVRDDGPQSHLKKNGTPTMGGIIFLVGVVASGLIFAIEYPGVIPVLIMTVGFALIGFVDDYIKVVLKRSMGLRAWQKMALQIIVTAIFAWYMFEVSKVSMDIIIPFSKAVVTLPNWLSIVVLFLAVLGTVNGSNFTDGLDGLASSVTAVIAAFFGIVAFVQNNDVAPIAFAFCGALLGFLLFNVYPARVFMGDTGSLSLGGFVVACAYMMNMPIFIILVAFIYFVEVLSVIMQVGYFKLTKGKRIFKMAPIHHHFELCGWSETKVVAVFTIITIIMCAIAFIAL